MVIQLPFGKRGIGVELSDDLNLTFIEPKFVAGLSDAEEALRQGLHAPIGCPPLRQWVQAGERVGIIFNDITRPTPNRELVWAVLAELEHIPPQDITLFNALGTHRANTHQELCQLLDEQLVASYAIVQNDAFDPATQVYVGKTSLGHEVWLNRQLMACEAKILLGFIEPHFFAGFSGGGKALMPGMAGQTTVFGNHEARLINHPKATWGNTWGNPIWEEIREVARMAGKAFLVNVTLNREREITGVFCGDLDEAHAQGCDFVRRTASFCVEEPFDMVITTNGGYPFDINLYQAVKGMSAAAQIVRPGGAIIIAAECADGIPEHGLYGQLLRAHSHPRQLLEEILSHPVVRQDQWQAQIQAQVQLKAQVYVYSDRLTSEQIRQALLLPCPRIEATLAELLKRYGRNARIAVLPEGTQMLLQKAGSGLMG